MNANMNNIRELSFDEIDCVSGGNLFQLAHAVLASDAITGKGAVLKLVEKAYAEKTGGKK